MKTKEYENLPKRCTECGSERAGTDRGFRLFRRGGFAVCPACYPNRPPVYTWSDNPSTQHV